MRRLAFGLCCCLLAIACRNVYADLRVGAGKQIITPDPLLPISGGMGPSVPATQKLGELTVRAIVIEGNDQRVAIVSVDALGFPAVLGNRVRALIDTIPAENILIGATHTHSAPDFYAFPDAQGGYAADLDYLDQVCRQCAQAIQDAIADLQLAGLKAATGEAQGKIAYNYYAPDLYDRRASVLQFVTPQDTVIATLVNYAVHPEVLGADQGVTSPDLVGPLCDRIEARAGGLALFMNGAQGGMVTADNRDLKRPSDPLRGYWEDIRDWDECLRIGHSLADESLRIVANAEIQHAPTLTCKSREVVFPVESDALWAVVTHSPLSYPHQANRTITTRLNWIRLGNVRMLTIPGEALPNIGFYLKRKMGGEHNLLLGLTNDAFGYILTEVDYASFERYSYISRVCLGEQTGEILIRESLTLLEETGE